MKNTKKCRLCLENKTETIELWSEIGHELQIIEIISLHFWFRPTKNDLISDLICLTCWTNVKCFHEFYVNVRQGHDELLICDSKLQNEDIPDDNIRVEHNPMETALQFKNEAETDFGNNDANDSTSNANIFQSNTILKCENLDSSLQLNESLSNKTKISTLPSSKKKQLNENEQIRQFIQLECNQCSLVFNTFSDVKSHFRKTHLTTGYVICCERKFFRRGGILEHIERHLHPDKFRCTICQKVYSDKRQLSIHMFKHEPDDKKQFKCDICGKRFLKKYYLSHHIKITHISDDKKIYKCDECGKRFILNSILQNHIRGVHQLKYLKICDICAKVFKSRAQWARHQLEHTTGYPKKVECTECNAWLKNDKSLKDHFKRCHEQKPASCEICGKISVNVVALKRHIRYVHEMKRLHKCSVCSKGFKTSHGLKEHEASHTGRVLYICRYCPKPFNSSANMHSHQKNKHHEEWSRDKNARNLKSDGT